MSEMKFIIKILCLIWVLFFPVVGFAQGQITRPKPPITRPTPRDNGKGSNKEEKTKGFVDLGLPSGTQWRSTNEDGLFDYNTAVNKYGRSMPTKEQLEELVSACRWTWNGSGYKVTGPNGNHIYIPANVGLWSGTAGNTSGLSYTGIYVGFLFKNGQVTIQKGGGISEKTYLIRPVCSGD